MTRAELAVLRDWPLWARRSKTNAHGPCCVYCGLVRVLLVLKYGTWRGHFCCSGGGPWAQ